MTKILIFQLKRTQENHLYFFTGLDMLKKHGLKVELDMYNVVYVSERDVEINNVYSYLEDLYAEFNIRHPEDFRGHSLSVSDIVKIDNDYYFCDSFGWKKITF